MSNTYKYITPEFKTSRQFNAEVFAQFTQADFGTKIQLYDAISGSGEIFNLPSDRIFDIFNYKLSYNYTLANNSFYTPLYEEMCYSGSVHEYDGNETYITSHGNVVMPDDGQFNIIGYPKRNIWYSLQHLFYRIPEHMRVYNIFMSSSLSETAYVFSIPKQYMPEIIKPKTFNLYHYNPKTTPIPYESSIADVTIIDDGYGNLYDSHNTVKVDKIGNISYDFGLVIITDSLYRNYFSSSFESNMDTAVSNLSYTSTKVMYENEYTCVIKKDEFNISTNPTLYESGSLKYFARPNVESSKNFNPYITSIGLYAESGSSDVLSVIAKLANPIKVEKTMDTIFIVKFDTYRPIII